MSECVHALALTLTFMAAVSVCCDMFTHDDRQRDWERAQSQLKEHA